MIDFPNSNHYPPNERSLPYQATRSRTLVEKKKEMGVLYHVGALTPEIVAWLEEIDVEIPDSAKSHLPDLITIRAVLDSLPHVTVDYTDNGIGNSWQSFACEGPATEPSRWTLLNISERGPEETPQEFWFEKGFPELIIEILVRCASDCGTLVLVPDTGDAPLLIPPSATASDLVSSWEHTNPTDD